MSITKNLGLNKHDNVQTNTDAFDIEKYLNDNWDIIDNSTGEITKNVGENLEKINTNEKNIETISTNVTGIITDISNLKEENERLRKDLQSSQIIGQANGERIDLDNSSDARFLKFGIGGNHSQETREGYNILKFENKTGAGVTYNGNRITVKNPTNYFYATTNVQGDKTFSGKSYKLKYIVNGTISSTDGNIRFYWGKTGNNYYAALSLSSGTFNNKEYNNTLYLGTDEIINNFRMEKPSDNCICDITIDVMLYEGTEDKAFEEYGKSPSPDYPSVIEVINNSNEIIVSNENFLKNTITDQIKNGITIINNDDGSLTLKGTAEKIIDVRFEGNWDNNISVLTLKKGRKYGILDTSSYSDGYYIVANGLNHKVVLRSTINDSDSITPTEDTEIYDIYLHIDKGVTVDKTIYPMIFEGLSSDYVEHQEQTLTMPVQQDMLKGDYFDWDNEKEVHVWKKISSYNGESITTDYISTTGELTTGSTVYYKSATPTELDFTDEQKAIAKQIKETLHTYKNVTHIYSNNETSPIFEIKYAIDPNIQNNKIQEQLQQLISTTKIKETKEEG